jgi:endonuclease III
MEKAYEMGIEREKTLINTVNLLNKKVEFLKKHHQNQKLVESYEAVLDDLSKELMELNQGLNQLEKII